MTDSGEDDPGKRRRALKRQRYHTEKIISNSLAAFQSRQLPSAEPVETEFEVEPETEVHEEENLVDVDSDDDDSDHGEAEQDNGDSDHGDAEQTRVSAVDTCFQQYRDRKKTKLGEDLMRNFTDHSLTCKAQQDILRTLRDHGHEKELPKDPRSLRAAYSEDIRFEVLSDESGSKCILNVGIAFAINGLFEASTLSTLPDVIGLEFNIDGLPLANSSSQTFWPILMSSPSIDSTLVAVVCLYYGYKKPSSKTLFQRFIPELIHLLENGYGNDYRSRVKINFFVCDLPAMQLIKSKQQKQYLLFFVVALFL
ncbi:MAG: hypothetical protein GY818_04670 [Planctomycetaceae bacterium]|nr:hypothetical protein [Planctomycetaceae bacterium]